MPRMLSVYLPRFAIHLLNIGTKPRSHEGTEGRQAGNEAIRQRGKRIDTATEEDATSPHRHITPSPNHPSSNSDAVLLIATDRGVERVACACEAAAAAGVRHGMTVAHARSLLAGRRVRIAPHRPEDVARALDRLVQWAFRFSPVVTADDPDGLLLDISGCAHLYAGEERLAKAIISSLERWRFPARVCVGPTAAVARAVARYSAERITVIPDHAADDELRFLPVSALGVEPAIRNALAEIGVVSLDQLLNLPREELAPRFGAALLSRIDHALGLAHELIEPARAIEPVEFVRTFEGAVRNQEAIFLVVQELLKKMIARLAAEESGVCRMTLTFHRIDESHETMQPRSHEEPAMTKFEPDISLSLSFPSRDFKHLWSLLRPRLERVHLGYGIEDIVLRVLQMQRLWPIQLDLWPDATSPTHRDNGAVLGQWLDQVIERIGRCAVVEMHPVERYLPEEAFTPQMMNQAQRSTFKAQQTSRKKNNENAGAQTRETYPASRPSQLHGPPQHARVIALVPDGPPAWIQWQGREEHVTCSYGPERLCGPWWSDQYRDHKGAVLEKVRNSKFKIQNGLEEKHDSLPHHPITTSPHHEMRDYFVIQTRAGLWLWVFRDQEGEWFVHGEWS